MRNELLTSGKVGRVGQEQMRLIREEVVDRWSDLGLLEGLDGYQKDTIAQIYENQANVLLKEGTDTSSAGSFETVVFPIIRRVFSKLLANDIVSVQALSMPIGRVFYFVPTISKRTDTGGHFAPDFYPNTATTTQFESKNLYDSFYEDANDPMQGLWDRSKGKYTDVTLTGATTVRINSTGGTDTVVATGCQRYITIAVEGFSQDGFGKLIGPDGNEMDTEEFLASLRIVASANITGCGANSGTTVFAAGAPVDYRVVTQKYARAIVDGGGNVAGRSYPDICDPLGRILIEMDLSTPACIECDSVDGYAGSFVANGTTFSAKFRRYDSLEFEAEIGEVSFTLESVTVSVTERKLRAQWSPEMAQDVSAFHNIDAEAELTAILSEQIAAEIDREILRDLRNGAAWKLRWDYNGWKRFAAGQAPYTQKDWNQELITAINQISAQIHKSTLRGGANWIVCSSEISAIFDNLEYFHVSNAAPEQDQYNMGIEKVGSIAGRYTVYRDPYFPANKLLMGHKGSSMLDTGYVYCPYVPLQLTPTLINPYTFAPVKGIMTRYAKKMLNNRFYGVITVDGVRTFNISELR